MRGMRILFTVSDLSYGGAQKQLVELARALSAAGHEVCIYTLNQDVPREPELEGSGVTLVVDQKRSRLDLAVLWRLRRKLEGWRPDVVHSFLFDADFYSRVAAFGTGIPVINSERSHNYTLSAHNQVAHWLTRGLARSVIANTYAGKSFAEKLWGFKDQHVHVVYNGLRVDVLERAAAEGRGNDYRREFFGPGEHKVACLVGAIKPAKDYRLALDAADRLVRERPQWRVLLVGEQLAAVTSYAPGKDSDSGSYKEEILAHYQGLEGRDRIRFTGLRTDVPAIVAQCDVLYITSAHEGSPNVVLEAMALGVPVVSTEYSDIRRILPVPGQVIGSRSAEALSLAIDWAYGNRARIAERQRQWVRQHATIEKSAADMERVYRRYARASEYALGTP
jgi:glycosyltransferase involved in cell wall biosynthesis